MHTHVHTPLQEGRKVRTTCRRLIVSAVQTLGNLQKFMTDLDPKEKAVFKQVRVGGGGGAEPGKGSGLGQYTGLDPHEMVVFKQV